MNTLKSVVRAVALMFALAVRSRGQMPTVCNPGTHGDTAMSVNSGNFRGTLLSCLAKRRRCPRRKACEIASLVELALHALLLA